MSLRNEEIEWSPAIKRGPTQWRRTRNKHLVRDARDSITITLSAKVHGRVVTGASLDMEAKEFQKFSAIRPFVEVRLDGVSDAVLGGG